MSEVKLEKKPNEQDIVLEALDNFNEVFKEKEKTDKIEEQKKNQILNEKRRKLLPITRLFAHFKELKLTVLNSLNYSASNKFTSSDSEDRLLNELLFKYSQRSTIGLHSPGVDLIVYHPCEMIISIPNKENITEFGEVVVSVFETKCPHVDLIKNKKFTSISECCNALAKFFAYNAISINKQK